MKKEKKKKKKKTIMNHRQATMGATQMPAFKHTMYKYMHTSIKHMLVGMKLSENGQVNIISKFVVRTLILLLGVFIFNFFFFVSFWKTEYPKMSHVWSNEYTQKN